MHRLTLALAATCLSLATPALAGPTEDFRQLMDDYWATTLKDAPTFATQTGVTTYDRELGVVTLAEFDRQAAEAAAFLKRLEAIPASALSAADQTNYSILKRTLSDAVTANRFGERQMLFSTLGSFHQFWAGLGEQQPFRTYADYDNYLARIGHVPEQMANMADISRKAAREGFVQPCVTLTTFEPTITGVIATDPAKSRFYAPFAAPKPSSVSDAQWADLQGRAKALITGKINPSYHSWANVYRTELAGKCRNSVGVSALPQGKDYYTFLVRQQTTTDRAPEEIHQLGFREVSRIRSEMEAVARRAGFASR